MIFTDLVIWWYGPGWRAELAKVATRPGAILDAFSVGLLMRTLFAPFKQIDAGGVRGPIQVQLRAWFDRTFSRVFGFFVRTIVICAGCIVALFVTVGSAILAILWLIVPLLPLFGLVFALRGWTI